MKPIEHFNKFCEKFALVRQYNSQGKLKSVEAQTTLMEMVTHYWEFDERMENYVSKWKMELVSLGFYIKLHCPEWTNEIKERISITDIEQEYKKEEFDEDYLIFRKDYAHKDKQKVIVANYCKYSMPWSELDKKHQNEIMKRTVENINNANLALTNPHKAKKKANKKVNKSRGKWTLPDNQRDW